MHVPQLFISQGIIIAVQLLDDLRGRLDSAHMKKQPPYASGVRVGEVGGSGRIGRAGQWICPAGRGF